MTALVFNSLPFPLFWLPGDQFQSWLLLNIDLLLNIESPGCHSQPLLEELTGSRDLSDWNAAKSGG